MGTNAFLLTIESRNELLQPCWVCGKQWKRKEVNSYCYFQDILVCASHKGAQKWYNAAIKLAEEKLRLERLEG